MPLWVVIIVVAPLCLSLGFGAGVIYACLMRDVERDDA